MNKTLCLLVSLSICIVLTTISVRTTSSTERMPKGISSSTTDENLTVHLIAVTVGRISGKQALRVYADFKWNRVPLWTFTDHIGISWSPGWGISGNSMQYSWTDSTNGHPQTSSSPFIYDPLLKDSNISWNYDLKMTMFSDKVYERPYPSGFASVDLVANSDDLLSSTYSCANVVYIHENLFHNEQIIRSVSWRNADVLNQ